MSFVAASSDHTSIEAADAQTARQSHQELLALYPAAEIRWVHRVVDATELAAHVDHILALVHPQTTVMDRNIGTALWFAASANPHDADDGTPPPRHAARVLLSGLGADELLGGYGRHRVAWERGGPDAWRQQLDHDVHRLWVRNLGRDDRVLADTGHEVRFPFLDANVMQFVTNQLSPHEIVDYTLPAGVGDKRILRLVAHRLGLVTAAGAVKRAIQFGSRIAHVSDKQRFGSRRKASGTAQIPSDGALRNQQQME